MPHNVLKGTDHTVFLGRYAGKAGKDAHPARAGAAILAFILPHAPQEDSKTDQAKLGAGRCSLPAEIHMARFARAKQTLSIQEVFSIP